VGGEWRAFWEKNENVYSIFDELYKNKSDVSSNNAEHRTDIYYVLPDERLGLKLRHETLCELKIRTKEKNNIEQWSKKFATSISNESNTIRTK